MTTYEKLHQAASVRRMATDSLQSYERICRDIMLRHDQVNAGLLSEAEAVQLIKQG